MASHRPPNRFRFLIGISVGIALAVVGMMLENAGYGTCTSGQRLCPFPRWVFMVAAAAPLLGAFHSIYRYWRDRIKGNTERDEHGRAH